MFLAIRCSMKTDRSAVWAAGDVGGPQEVCERQSDCLWFGRQETDRRGPHFRHVHSTLLRFFCSENVLPIRLQIDRKCILRHVGAIVSGSGRSSGQITADTVIKQLRAIGKQKVRGVSLMSAVLKVTQ